ncbi:hypothetical protein KKB43_06865 [Patescibacteria group bacterium]|nr:hypothetical protein [Patescibacteria group bacterium]MBU4580700.1 hypothetical protein [Patescibacteria group bacterium]
MNKLNYLLIPAIIILLIGNVFLYSNLSKQNSDIKKDISELKQEQINQQASQKENLENLQNLVTFNWKEYQNDEFGFSFKYPDYANVCDDTINLENFEKTDLNLRIRLFGDPCDEKDVAPAYIIVKKNTENYKTVKEAFNKELLKDYATPDPSYAKELQEAYESVIKTNFTYFKIGGLDAYGGKVVSSKPSSDPRITDASGYKAIILKNDYLLKIDGGYEQIFEGRKIGDKSIFDAMIFSLYFNHYGLLK